MTQKKSSEEKSTYGFSHEVQRKIVSMLLFDAYGFVQNMEVIDPGFFDNPALGDMVKIFKRFFEKYDRVPDVDEFLEEFGVHLGKNLRLPEAEYYEVAKEVLERGKDENFDYVKDIVIDFARYQAVKKAIIASVDLLQKKKDYEGILTKVQEALLIGEGSADLGTDYFKELEARLIARRSGATRHDTAIKTWIPSLDTLLGGGWGRGELAVVMGATKRGKTIMAANCIKGALYEGLQAIHYGFEGSERRTQVIYDSMLSGVPKEELKENEERVREAVNTFQKEFGGHLIIKHYPADSCSVRTIEGNLQKLKFMEGFEPSLVVVDYLGLMKPIMVEGEEGRYSSYGQIVKQLLSLAQRNEFAVILLHQSTRASFKKKVVDKDDSADSVEPMRDADVILTLNQDENEEKAGEMRIFSAGGREVADRIIIPLKIDKSRCQISEPGEGV